VPSFEAFRRALEVVNPSAFWAEVARVGWLPWLETTRLMGLPWGETPSLPKAGPIRTRRSADSRQRYGDFSRAMARSR
jgi:hypothetical protein